MSLAQSLGGSEPSVKEDRADKGRDSGTKPTDGESWCLVSNALMDRELIHDLPHTTVLRTVKYVCVYLCMLRTYAQVKNSSLMYHASILLIMSVTQTFPFRSNAIPRNHHYH